MAKQFQIPGYLYFAAQEDGREYQIPGYLYFIDVATSTSNIKTINGLAKASVKTVNGLAIASMKTRNGLA